MEKFLVPLKNPKPDIEKFLKIMRGDIKPDKPPIAEFYIDNTIIKKVLEIIGKKWINLPSTDGFLGGQVNYNKNHLEEINGWLDNFINFWYHMGYDFVHLEQSLNLPSIYHFGFDASSECNTRSWLSSKGIINNWEDFEKYPWPVIKEEDFYIHKYILDNLPEGMGYMANHAGGVFIQTFSLMGYETLCMKLHDDPDLIKAITDRIGELIFKYDKMLLELDGLSAVFMGEDYGFNTQCLISPEHLKKYFLPWMKKSAQETHNKNKPYFLHCCGNVEAIMGYLIDEVKIDGKHSFQDNVLPVTEAKKMYGDRICLIGGVDIDKLARLQSLELRHYVRDIMDRCTPGGKFAIGSGNSVCSFIPLENYLTMVDESLR